MIDGENLYFVASWDTTQINATEMERHCDSLVDVMRRLIKQENWGKTVGEVFGLEMLGVGPRRLSDAHDAEGSNESGP